MNRLIRDFFDHDAVYYMTMVLPAKVAAPAVVEWAAMLANAARGLGLRRLAVAAAIYGYDIADHDPADATWELHRRRLPWAYMSGSFRPTHALAAEHLHQRRYGEMA
jgi:hypothetical protein